MFSVEDRERVRDRIVQMSRADQRLSSGALIGSTVGGGGDRWSDLDLTFGLVDTASMEEVLADWTDRMASEFGAVHLFDLPHLGTVYRVFLLPGNLQVDLSFTPGDKFLGKGLKHETLFGKAVEREPAPPPQPKQVFGMAVVYLLHARACIERNRFWEAEYCISAARNQALILECLNHGLRTSYGRGYDDLPPETLKTFSKTLIGTLDKSHLLRTLGETVDRLLKSSQNVGEVVLKIQSQLREIAMTGV
ncbi:nucleotidyltransferase domain-containing protein [Candidatus Bathyarchaeota archaeon]|nr:nucleotidyltransferase domain-containing protein [Candidatus Bathyarchaeota archaeon]